MKKNIILLSILLMISNLMISCGILEPQESENPQLLKYIAEDYLDQVCGFDDEWHARLNFGNDYYPDQKVARDFAQDIDLANQKYDGKSSISWCENNWNRFMTITPINVVLNEQMLGDTYTGYFVTYSLQISQSAQKYFSRPKFYYLVQLTEFDNGHWEAKIIDSSTSLSNVQSNLY